MCFKDHANKKSNQKNFGVIHSSNLCVDENTEMSVKIGETYKKTTIKEAVEYFRKDVVAYNMEPIEVLGFNEHTGKPEYKKIINGALTGNDAEVYRVTDEETGKELICTGDHKVFTKNRGYVFTKDLVPEDILLII
jgi:intein/homing endonuclease